MTNRLEAWKHRSLSLKGKALIVNTIALSGLVFVGTIYHLPPAIEKQVNRAIFQFIWAGKNELVSRKKMFQPTDKGGQGVVDIHLKTNALHLKFLQSIIDTNYDSPWVYFARYNIGFQLFKYFPNAKFLRSNLFPHALTPTPHYTLLLALCNLFKKCCCIVKCRRHTCKYYLRQHSCLGQLRHIAGLGMECCPREATTVANPMGARSLSPLPRP